MKDFVTIAKEVNAHNGGHMRKWVGVLAFSAATLGATSALAQTENFGKSMTLAFSADRLFGFYKAHHEVDEDRFGPDRDDDWTGFGFGWYPSIGAYPFNMPRFAFDIFVIDNLSLGGAIGYSSVQDDDDGFGDTDYSAFIFSPRIGYWIGIGKVVGFWPRGGFTYHSLSVEPAGGGDYDENGLALTLEGMFGIGPVEHFMFMVGPTVDFDMFGHRDSCRTGQFDDDDCKWKYRSFGIQVGLLGWI
jgi:hypothetical protein